MQTALVTGATAGFGRAIALRLAKLGYRLILTGRRVERLEEVRGEISRIYPKSSILLLNFDVRDKSACKEAFNLIPSEFHPIELLVNNAGLAAGVASFEDSLEDDFDRMIDTNVKGLLYVTDLVVTEMVKAKKGHIVNLSSIAGIEVYPGGHVYCATKHAVNAITKGMRIDLVKHGIKVSSISPGMAETEFSIVRYHGDEEKAKNVYQGLVPLRAEDIADTLEFIVTRPAHVMINDIQINPSQQANTYISNRENSLL